MSTSISSFAKEYVAIYSGLKKTCWQGILLSFVESTLAGVYYFLSIYFVDVLHFNISIAGMIISFYGLGTIFGVWFGGRLSDKFSPFVVSAAGLLIQAIALLILIKFKLIQLLMLDLFVLGIATYSFITSNYVWVLNQCENIAKDRLKAINLLSVASNFGIGLSAIIISVFIGYGFQRIFFVCGACLFALAMILFLQNKSRLVINHSSDYKKNIPDIVRVEAPINKNKNVIWLVLSCLF